MLPKLQRIKKKKDFEAIFKKAKSFKKGFLIFKVSKNSLDVSRFGFVVSQKVSKKATIRNKVRRRLASIIKSEVNKIANGIDVIIIALPGIEKEAFLSTKEGLVSSLEKEKIINRS